MKDNHKVHAMLIQHGCENARNHRVHAMLIKTVEISGEETKKSLFVSVPPEDHAYI